MRVLLVEPKYKNKYPPMGLMKISTYHKNMGDTVRFVKGYDSKVEAEEWDRIYITTLFTFYFDITAETIKHYIKRYGKEKVYVGGIMSSLLTDELIEATQIDPSHILKGLFTDTSVVGDNNDINVDEQPLDYDMLEDIEYKYPAGDSYLSYTTRGCPNHCSFCAVPKLEPEFRITNNILKQIEYIDNKYGPKRNLLLLDNNVLNAPMNELKKIVDDLCAAGFGKDSVAEIPSEYNIVMSRYQKGDRAECLDRKMLSFLKTAEEKQQTALNKHRANTEKVERLKELVAGAESTVAATDGKYQTLADYMFEHKDELNDLLKPYTRPKKNRRYIDFNQGIDSRKINDENMAQLSRLAIKPLRIAFDHVELKDVYCNAIRTAHKYGIKHFSNYILFNYKDKPEDLYERLKINIELSEKLDIDIFSFPMKYAPVDRKDRKYVGEHWNKHALQNISAILNATKGVVGMGSTFFYKAFGSNLDEYRELLAMPHDMVTYRLKYERLGLTDKWKKLYQSLSPERKEELTQIISHTMLEMKACTWPQGLKKLQEYYITKY